MEELYERLRSAAFGATRLTKLLAREKAIGPGMEEIEDSLMALVSEFNARTGRNIELLPGPTAPDDPSYLVFSLRDLSSDKTRTLTLCIFDVVEPWGNVGLPEATAEINEALSDFWNDDNHEPNRIVYIPPKHAVANASDSPHS